MIAGDGGTGKIGFFFPFTHKILRLQNVVSKGQNELLIKLRHLKLASKTATQNSG